MAESLSSTPDAPPAFVARSYAGNGQPRLAVKSLVTGYDKKQVLHGIDMTVGPGEIVSVIGHNGAGKSTLLKAIFGTIPFWGGEVFYEGKEFGRPDPHRWLAQGAAYVPQGNRVFSDLTVRENLEVASISIQDKRQRSAGVERALAGYPQLGERLRQNAGTLSGGEKQMLALANALVLAPRLLLLDEPSLGLAPALVTDALERVQTIAQNEGTSVLIVEQKVREVLRIADRVYVLRNGGVSFTGAAESLADEATLRAVYL